MLMDRKYLFFFFLFVNLRLTGLCSYHKIYFRVLTGGNFMEYEIKKLKRIDMHTYHRLISCYGKEKINQYFDLEIEKSIQEGISLEEIWGKFGYYLATLDKNLFYEDILQKMKKNSVNKRNGKSLFSLEDEVYYGFHLLKKDYIQIFAHQDSYVDLDLGKIFSSIKNVDTGKELVKKFRKFYFECNRCSNFDQYFQIILKKYQKGLQEDNVLSCLDLSISSSEGSSLSEEELLEQVDMYLDYSKAVYLFQVYNIRLVKYYVSLYFKDWHITDLEQCGMIGLTEAIFKFDIRKGTHFCSYAYFNIKRAIFNSAYVDYHLFGMPLGIASLQNRAMKITDMYYFYYGKKITDEELALKLNFKDVKLLSFLRDRNYFNCQSLQESYNEDNDCCFDYSINQEEDVTLMDNISYEIDKFEDIEDVLDRYDFSILIQVVCQILSPRDREILFKRIGYQLDDAMGLQQIGEEYHLTCEGVRKICQRSILKLKKSKRIKSFSPYQ